MPENNPTCTQEQGIQTTTSVAPSDGAVLRAAQRFLDCARTPSDLATKLTELRTSGDLALAIPEFAETWGPRGEQSPDWHPEGNVWTHTLMVVDSLPANASYALTLAAIFHDISKPATFFKFPTSGGITFHGHAQVGADLFRREIGPRLGLAPAIIEHAANIIEYHMFMHDFFKPEVVRPDFQEHILSLPYIHELIEMQHADVNGTGISQERKVAASYKERFLALVSQRAKTE